MTSSAVLARFRTVVARPRIPLRRRQRHRLVQIVADDLLLIEVWRFRTAEMTTTAATVSRDPDEVFRDITGDQCLFNDPPRAVDHPDHGRLRRRRSRTVIVAATISRRERRR